MMYSPNLYEIDEKNLNRFILGQSGENMLAVIGVNPSTADDSKPDPTLRKVIGFAKRAGFEGFVMCNIYPQRTADPLKLHVRKNVTQHRKNLQLIQKILHQHNVSTILAAWGASIELRRYLFHCLADIYNQTSKDINWLQIGNPTKGGHPRHPSRAAYECGLKDFDIFKYISHFREKSK